MNFIPCLCCRKNLGTSLPYHGKREGQIVVMFVAAIFVLCGIAVLAVDVGHLCVSRARMQNAADAGSLAGLLELWDARADGADEIEARGRGVTEHEAIANANYPGVGSEVQFGIWANQTFMPKSPSVPANAVRVRVYRSKDAPGGPVGTFFGGLMGLNSVEQDASATAHFIPPGLAPFSIYEENLVEPDETLVLYDDKKVTPGVFGLLDYDGGSNSASDLKEWTRHGYQGKFDIDPEVGYKIVEGSPGLKTTLKDPLDYHVTAGDNVISCVYEDVWGSGNNTQFQVNGFASLVITESNMNANPKSVSARMNGYYLVGDGTTKGLMHKFMRLRLVE